MLSLNNSNELSFLIYGLGLTGQSVIKFFQKNNLRNYQVWDDKNKNLFKKKRSRNLNKSLEDASHIILSPGVNLNNSKNRRLLLKYKHKIITDIDLVYLFKRFYKSIVVTGTNGKSTTCKILYHVLKKIGYKPLLGGNIGTPLLSLSIKKKNFLIIEASSFQLAYSKYIRPDYAFLLNISNDHLDWHGNMKNYIDSKFKIFNQQKINQYAFINDNLKKIFIKKKLPGKLIVPKINEYRKKKYKIQNSYLNLDINDENMSYVYAFSKIFKINEKTLFNSLNTFIGLPHRYEIFLKKKNCIFVNDSKATSFESTKFALKNLKNIFWIVGGLPKKGDNIKLNSLKKNIIKSYIIGKNTNFFSKQLKNKVKFKITKNLKKTILEIFKDIKSYNKNKNIILLSPASASYDQFLNFEKRGNEFKRLIKNYAERHI